MVDLGPLGPATLMTAICPRCWCGETGAEIIPGDWLCEAGHEFHEPEPQRMVRELAEFGIPIYLDPRLLRETSDA